METRSNFSIQNSEEVDVFNKAEDFDGKEFLEYRNSAILEKDTPQSANPLALNGQGNLSSVVEEEK